MMLSENIVSALGDFRQVVFDEKFLDKKTASMAALAVSVALSCRPCTQHYYQDCKALGATNEEVSSIIGIAMTVLAGKSKAYALAAIDDVTQ